MTDKPTPQPSTEDHDEAQMTIDVVGRIAEISADDWNACANPDADAGPYLRSCDAQDDLDNPFISHGFLESLEISNSVGDGTGWYPRHLLVKGEDGMPAAVMPAYLKTHSQGEYVFDYGWADAYERAGGRYYPKLQVSVPFTPATGRRLLVKPGPDMDQNREALIAGAIEVCRQANASSIHWTFLTEPEWAALGDHGLLQRTDRQFHWENNGYDTFDDFLASLASRKRKAVRRERREALAAGLEVEWLTGADLTEDHWDAFFAFYIDTGDRKWGRPYLTRAFFSEVTGRMADRVLLILAKRDGAPIAGALNFIGGNTLYGRNWGCVEDHPFLHFELCYYQAIDYAIANGLARVEAGAQGEHKLSRGYLPVTTYSAHYIADPRLREPVADYLARERMAIDYEQRILAEHSPFKRAHDG